MTTTMTPRRPGENKGHPTDGRQQLRRLALYAGLALLLVLPWGLLACSGSDDYSGGEASSSYEYDAGATEAPEQSSGADSAKSVTTGTPMEREVINTGSVTLSGGDLTTLRGDVDEVVGRHRGITTDEESTSDADGELSSVDLTVRVPADEFDATMGDLKTSGRLEYSSVSSDDVTTEVIDTDARVRAQERSLERVEVLFGRAQNIRDIMAIESELARRQADLDSLRSQQSYLKDQTSMSTITVRLSLPDEVPADSDETGFLAGLAAGWGALLGSLTAIATLAGAVLPFVVVLAVLGLPVALLLRRRAARARTRSAA